MLIADRTTLVLALWPMCMEIATQWCRRNPWLRLEVEDVAADARAGLVEAAARYDPASGVKFATYGRHYALFGIRRRFHNELAHGVHVPWHLGRTTVPTASLDVPTGRDEDGTAAALVPDRDHDPDEPPDPPRADLWDCLPGLTDRERHVLALYYRDGRTLREIAVLLGHSRQAVQQAVARALRKLRGCDALDDLWQMLS